MFKTKTLGLIALASTSFLFSGCVVVEQPNTFYDQNGYSNAARINVSLSSYAYPYYYDRPFYFFNGLYYYGGYYRNGFYHYGNRHFRHGHYYNHGNRYYNGRRYRARNGRYGYYRNRNYYERSRQYKTSYRNVDRGRVYQGSRQQRPAMNRSGVIERGRNYNTFGNKVRRSSTNYVGFQRPTRNVSHSYRNTMGSKATMQHRVRSRPVR